MRNIIRVRKRMMPIVHEGKNRCDIIYWVMPRVVDELTGFVTRFLDGHLHTDRQGGRGTSTTSLSLGGNKLGMLPAPGSCGEGGFHGASEGTEAWNGKGKSGARAVSFFFCEWRVDSCCCGLHTSAYGSTVVPVGSSFTGAPSH